MNGIALVSGTASLCIQAPVRLHVIMLMQSVFLMNLQDINLTGL